MSANVNVLITMANQIGDFFDTMKNREQSLEEIASHLRRFWEPRMRLALLAHVDQQAGAGLNEIVLDSLNTHRNLLALPARP
ncbi:formate dehydrogenase subunit delta [Janthinobacterium sp. PC23-8]|uniref:formate dehydrogenase subunit delta n=1 Tax=Janthinobacterium sp. PC23-8 TaxID=2012679 RepID=UPI000B96D652|nr:formate dehydrogenase subunit delta [Janthinobacterium sp. PC23-8]OYO29275.1 formate dehydrogenase [Janthinobacterium sp. PC23-8]